MIQESKFFRDLSDLLYGFDLTQNQITEVCVQATVAMLPKQQRQVYDKMYYGKHKAVDANYLSYVTGLGTKNISSQIKQIQKKTNLIGVVKEGNKYKYFKY